MPRQCVIELHYLPCLSYFAHLLQYDEVLIEVHESFQKQTYRNRCYINTSNGTERLSIPLIKANRHHPIKGVKIDNNTPWAIRHIRAIEAAYAKAPFYEYYAEDFFEVLRNEHENLLDLNKSLLTPCLLHLEVNSTFSHTDSYKAQSGEDVADLRGVIHPKRTTGTIPVNPYLQVFGTAFIDNLSILDLLFCEGPNARRVLEESVAKFKFTGN